MISWVVGRGGLLGQSVDEALQLQGATWRPPLPFSWDRPEVLGLELTAACRDFASHVGSSPWQIAWCAGAGTVGSELSNLDQEIEAISILLKSITSSLRGPGRRRGAFFLTSSAGGVYAGGTPPFDERSQVSPLAPYGWSKLEQEALAREWSRETSTPLLIGRLANLYGPGQNLLKSQGLITQVCLRALTRQPLTLYVPLDTIRDYLFSADAGRMIADGMALLHLEASQAVSTPVVTKILSSQRPTTIATVLAQVRWITKRSSSVIMAASPNTGRQARDLRMISSVWTELDRRPLVTLSEGIRCVLNSISDGLSSGAEFLR